MPHATPTEVKPQKKLVLCFDGTGNTFSGSTADTNIVKLYDKFDRYDDENQFHYYQTGIGTYDIGGGSLNKGFLGNLQSSISSTLDSGFATTFDAHVMAGYRFVMRYYDKGDKIYMFGFSRGAFTARFLARMINTVGLLSKGNEEMVPFAYQIYQRYEQGKLDLKAAEGSDAEVKGDANAAPGTTAVVAKATGVRNGVKTPSVSVRQLNPSDGASVPLLGGGKTCDAHDHESLSKTAADAQKNNDELKAFRRTFCRLEKDASTGKYKGVQVFFLGIFDCVSSVKVLEGPFGKTPPPVPVTGTAHHVRHAVAIDERRVKFKAALMAEDRKDQTNIDDIKEVWFPGNHGDVGGGWPAPILDDNTDPNSHPIPLTWWQKVKRVFNTSKPKYLQDSVLPPYQMSDIPLAWMIEELKKVDASEAAPLSWNEDRLHTFEHNFYEERYKKQALTAASHDTMRIGGGSSFFKVLLWNFMEFLPFMARWELGLNGEWYHEKFWPNCRSRRDIPRDAKFHNSVLHRLENHKDYKPLNNFGGNSKPCLTGKAAFETKPVDENDGAAHATFKLKSN